MRAQKTWQVTKCAKFWLAHVYSRMQMHLNGTAACHQQGLPTLFVSSRVSGGDFKGILSSTHSVSWVLLATMRLWESTHGSNSPAWSVSWGVWLFASKTHGLTGRQCAAGSRYKGTWEMGIRDNCQEVAQGYSPPPSWGGYSGLHHALFDTWTCMVMWTQGHCSTKNETWVLFVKKIVGFRPFRHGDGTANTKKNHRKTECTTEPFSSSSAVD